MKSIRIKGKSVVSGEIVPGGNKNAALPIIAASLLTNQPVTLHNIPCILDVNNMLAIAEMTGASITRSGSDVTIHAKDLNPDKLPLSLCASLRASFIFAGTIAARCGYAKVGLPGGDFIGRRRLDSHYYGLEKLGILGEPKDGYSEFKVEKSGLHSADIFLDEASVTATEHIVIAAVLAPGKTYLRNAAMEPHVQQLCEFLNAMGAKIEGIGSSTIIIHGVSSLKGTEFTIESDYIEACGYMCMAAATGGELLVTGTFPTRHFWMTRRIFERFNIDFKLEPNRIFLPGNQNMKIKKEISGAIPVISDGPWPQFPSDMMSCLIVAATQAEGTVLFFEKMFESRIYFVDRLIAMGANAIVCDPHRVVISGPSMLTHSICSSPDIRAGMAMIAAAAMAHGESTIHNAETIFRGYENLIEKLNALHIPSELMES